MALPTTSVQSNTASSAAPPSPPNPALVCEILSSLASPRDLLLQHHASTLLKQRLAFLLPTSPNLSDADLLLSLLWSSPPHPLLTPPYLQFVLADRYARGGSSWLEDDVARSGRLWQRDPDTLEYHVPVDLRPDPGNPLHMMRVVLVLVRETEAEGRWKFLDLRVLPDAEWTQLSDKLAAAARTWLQPGQPEAADKGDPDQGNEDDSYWAAYESRTLPSKSSAQRLDAVNGDDSDEEDAGYWGQYDSIRAPSPANPPPAVRRSVPAPVHAPAAAARRPSATEPLLSPHGPTLAELEVPAAALASVPVSVPNGLPLTLEHNPTSAAVTTCPTSEVSSVVQSRAQLREPVLKHVQASVQSLWGLASASGISRQEFLVLIAASMDKDA